MQKKQQTRHKDIEKLSFLTQEERTAVIEFAELIRKQFGRGKSEKESDIDILLVLSSLSWEIKKSISEQAAEENMKHNVLISTVRYDASTWDDPVIKASPFAKTVRREGVWL